MLWMTLQDPRSSMTGSGARLGDELSVIGAHQLGLDHLELERRQRRIAEMLSRALNIRPVVASIGSALPGADSVGCATWRELPAAAVEPSITACRNGDGQAELKKRLAPVKAAGSHRSHIHDADRTIMKLEE